MVSRSEANHLPDGFLLFTDSGEKVVDGVGVTGAKNGVLRC